MLVKKALAILVHKTYWYVSQWPDHEDLQVSALNLNGNAC